MNRIAFLVCLLLPAGCSILPAPSYRGLSLEERAARASDETAQIRDLARLADVPVAFQKSSSFRDVYAQSLDEEWDARGANQERIYRVLGLVEPETDLRPFLVDVVPEIVAGYYDPETKEYFVVGDDPPADDPSWDDDDWDEFDFDIDDLDRLLVLPHELTHAIEDQHFDFLATDARLAGDSDRGIGHSALVEGSAMEAGVDHVLWRIGLPVSTSGPFLRRWIEDLNRVPVLDLRDLGKQYADDAVDLERLKNAPPIVQQGFLFPYIHGWGFTNRLRSEFGWKGVDAAHADPPESSEQILFPERYIDRRDRPVRIELPAAPSGWRLIGEETLGMFGMRVLLATRLEAEAASVADGWDGDRLALFETPEGDAIGWVSVWDHEGAARDFEVTIRALASYQETPGRYAVVRNEDVVAVVLSAPADRADAVARELLGATLHRAPDDQAPDRWYGKLLRFPIAFRILDRAVQTHLLGGYALNYRKHADGHRFDLLNGIILNTENNPDRTSSWLGLGLIGFTRDRTLDYSFARIPLLFYWHGRGDGDAASLRWSLLPFRCIDWVDRRGNGEFDLLWGILVSSRWGPKSIEGKRLRILGIPVPGF